jgi:hypothetical protein
MSTNNKISHLYEELPQWIEFRKRDIEERIATDSDWPVNSIAEAYFDLGHGKLVNNEIEEAKDIFNKGARILISNGIVRSDIHIDIYGEGHRFPIYGYLGGNIEMAGPIAKRVIMDYQIARKKGGYLSPAEIIYEDYYQLLNELLLNNIDEIQSLIESLDKRLYKFKISAETIYKKSGLYHKYPIFGKEMIKALFSKDERRFSDNVYHWSQLMLNAISIRDTPSTLAEIELILLYDLALGNGMKPKIDTPFIPKSIIENGYWNKPTNIGTESTKRKMSI